MFSASIMVNRAVYICMLQNDVADMFQVFLAGGDVKSFTYNQQTTVAVSKAYATLATFSVF